MRWNQELPARAKLPVSRIHQSYNDSADSFKSVEYTDPSGVFPLISDPLLRRLPLSNLHWTSTSRPLRSISSLHVEFVPDSRRTSRGAFARPGSEDRINGHLNGGKERRHQIPGLRQTPYLKIYLLRCNDTETYKATSRKLLREWVKEHTPPSQSSSLINKADNHDAFEWLIIHVVLINEDASKGPRISGSSKGENHSEKVSGASRWSARGSSTLIEKIRSDFNASSKTSVDRVAQIHVDGDFDLSARSDISEQEDKNGFNDLTSKLKSLILASFDQRVSQYEEDIREKDSQRNLPGWNFNTFFLLKEGLARGFESVGLVEDALASYHELSASLDTIVAGQLKRLSSGGETDNFCEFTDDLLESLRQAIDATKASSQKQENSSENPDPPTRDHENNPYRLGATVLDTDRKPYRDLILANNISAFDFLCYVFARQVSLLLRLANLVPLRDISPIYGGFDEEHHKGDVLSQGSKRMSKSDQPEPNLMILADICRHAVNFLTSTSRVIRSDLDCAMNHLAQSGQVQDMIWDSMVESIIENLIASWTFSACESILEKTYVPSLLTQLEGLLRHYKEYNSIGGFHQEGSLDSVHNDSRENLPRRTSSLQPPNSTNLMSPSPKRLPAVTLLDSVRLLPRPPSHTGSENLAAQRADLSNLARGILGNLGSRHAGWVLLARMERSENGMEEISLDDSLKEAPTRTDAPVNPFEFNESTHAPTRSGIHNPLLASAISSEDSFYAAYEVIRQDYSGIASANPPPRP